MNSTENNPEPRKLPIGERIIFAFLCLCILSGLALLVKASPAGYIRCGLGREWDAR